MQEQKKIVGSDHFSYELFKRIIWITKYSYEDGTYGYGIDSTKKGSMNIIKPSFANLGLPSFMTEMGSVNKDYKNFFVVENSWKYLKDNCPGEILENFLPTVCINPDIPNEVALVCEDVITKEVFYIHCKEKAFLDSLNNCIKQLIVRYIEPISGIPTEVTHSPKINSWVLTYLKKQLYIGFYDIVHFEELLVDNKQKV